MSYIHLINYIDNYYIYDNQFILKFLIDFHIKKLPASDHELLLRLRRDEYQTITKYIIEQKASNIDQCLIASSEVGNINIIKYIVQKKRQDIKKGSELINTLLMAACKYGHEDIVKYLVEHEDASVNYINEIPYLKMKNGYYGTPLMTACENGNEAIVKYLVEKGANINIEFFVKYKYWTPLAISCKYGHEKIVKYLIENGANKITLNGFKPFINACIYERKIITKYFLENEEDVNVKNIYYGINLSIACKNGNETIVKYIVEKEGTDIINYRSNKPLIWACENGNETIVKYLVEKGADINKGMEHGNGNTPLIAACKEGHENIIKYLIEKGADINIGNRKGIYPIYKAYESGKIDIVKFLMDYAEKNNIILKLDNYLLINTLKSINYTNTDFFEILIKYATNKMIPLNINESNNHGNYLLLQLMKENYYNDELVKLLMNYATKLNIKLKLNGKNWRTHPLIQAIRNNYYEKVKLLIDYAENHNIILYVDSYIGFRNISIYEISNDVKINKLLKKFEYSKKLKFI